MSINFNFAPTTPITLWQPEQIKEQDIYFQPGLTWTQKGTQGVALLFLENDTSSGDPDKQDFRELVKGLVRWVWAAAGKSETAQITMTEVQNLYNEFTTTTTTSLKYTDLKTFLNTHYRFKIQECSEDMDGTVFPMFPNLEMKVGTNESVSFSPADKKLDSDGINHLRAFYGQLQVKFGTESAANTIDANSVTAFLFVGYARLLIRNGLQAIIDYLKAGPNANNIVNLLDVLLPNDRYRNIAQMASRFLLNGFNLPKDFFGPDDPTADEGLYVSTGQQYTLSDSLVSSGTSSDYQVTLRMGSVTEDFITFPENPSDGKPHINYILNTTNYNHPFVALANALNTLNGQTDEYIKGLHSAKPKLIPPYRTENLHFALRNRVQWGSSYLLPLPTALLNHLEQHTPNPPVDLRVWPNGDPAQAIDIPNDNFTWATRIDLTLQRIPNPDGDGFLKETYEIGSSSEKDKDLLEAVWKSLNPPRSTPPATTPTAELSLLYVSNEGGTTNPSVTLVPGVQDDILLLKTNLSTETTVSTSTNFSAKLSEETDFLKLLWTALDVDTGGFYLHIPHGDTSLDATVFKGDNSAVLPFLIQFTNPSDPIHDFNNYAVFTKKIKVGNEEKDIDVEADLVLARSEESIPVLTIPPGFLGFQIDDRPEAPFENNDVSGELKVLYQLLGWQVAAHTQFKASHPGLPIGPTQSEYDLKVIPRESNDALPSQGKGLVAVKKIDDFYHVSIFDKSGVKVIDKGNGAFTPDAILVSELEAALNQSLDDQAKRKLTQDIISSLGRTPEWLYERLVPVFSYESYELNLIPPESDDALPSQGKGLVAVKKIGDFYHVCIFDKTGKKVIYKGNGEFTPDKNLVLALEAAFSTQSSDGQEIDNQTKHKLIRGITSDLKYPSNELPNRDMNPYLGIGAASEFKVETWWQDIYGNQLLASQAEQTFPIRYTDALIGINQWPSVSENYTFFVEPGNVTLKLTFSFDPSPYSLASHAAAQDPATSRANRIKGDKATIEKVYYQLIQDDIGFTVSTSIAVKWTSNVDKTLILKFVKDIYGYLDGSLRNESPLVPTPYAETIDASDITIKPSFIFPVTVNMEMARDLALVSDDLKSNGNIKGEYENVRRAPATLSPKFESSTITVAAGQSLAQLAIAASQAPTKIYTAVDLLLANPNHSGLLNATTILTPTSLTPNLNLLKIKEQDWTEYVAFPPSAITIQAGESPQMLAQGFRADMEQKLARTVNFSVADLAVLLADKTDLLTEGAEMLIGGLTIQSFARNFQAAFPGLLLAVSEDRQNRTRSGISQQPLYAVRLGLEYDLSLISSENADDLPKQGKALIIVAKIEDFYHARVFDKTGNQSLDKGKDEFLPDKELFEKLEIAFNGQASDVQEIGQETKTELIRKLISNLNLTLSGIYYDIQEGQPTYYAIPPLSNVLLSGEVAIQNYAHWKGQDNTTYNPESENSQFDAIDLNVLARSFLVALESFLDPATLVPAYRLYAEEADNKAKSILQQKAILANALSEDILPVLRKDAAKTATSQFSEAKEAIRQELLVDLVNGYDIETIVQFAVRVEIGSALSGSLNWHENEEPRIRGKAKVGVSSLFVVGNIKDVPSLIIKLQSDSNPSTKLVSQFIWAEVDPAKKQLLADHNSTSPQKQSALVQAFNKILQSNSIYEPTRFADVTLRRETQSLIAQSPTGEGLIRLNRLLLEDTYPLEIARNNTPDFKLSTGKIRLRNDTGTSYFTYLFDTKTPELFANLDLDLQFVPTEIEYDIQPLAGITDRQASNFLNFVLPEDLKQPMGSSPIPIPLREYPAPPSLIFQRAEADPTSRTVLADVRQWQYTVVYEHLDISQDSIDCILQLNVPPIDNLPTESGTISQPGELFGALVNFGEIYPQIAIDLNSLRSETLIADETLQKTAKIAILAFESLVIKVATGWKNWKTDKKIYSPADSDLHFVISEEALRNYERQGLVTVLKTVASKIGGPAIKPTLALPGYKHKESVPPATVTNGQTTTFTFVPDPKDLTFFGDSSIPDRKFTVENLDVIEHHNAWASVWLSRNKKLISKDTNPAFIFQTPAVRFNNMVTPFITNDEPWDIATLGASDHTPQSRTLEEHLTTMINVLFPRFPGNKYEIRLSCRYAFSLTTGKGLNEDLVTTLPILLGLQITPEKLAGGNPTDSYATHLSKEIKTWLQKNRPSREMASLMFTVDLFSKLNDDSTSSLPTLRITHLRLGLEQIKRPI